MTQATGTQVMQQLPEGWWWKVRVSQRNDCVFLCLMQERTTSARIFSKRSSFIKSDERAMNAAVVYFMNTPIEDQVVNIVKESYVMWEETIIKPDTVAAMQNKAAGLFANLPTGSTRVETVVDLVDE